jgi:hypothetical protein
VGFKHIQNVRYSFHSFRYCLDFRITCITPSTLLGADNLIVTVRILKGQPTVDFAFLRLPFSDHRFIESLALIYGQGIAKSLPLSLGEKSGHRLLANRIVMSDAVVKERSAVWACCSKSPNDEVDILLFHIH